MKDGSVVKKNMAAIVDFSFHLGNINKKEDNIENNKEDKVNDNEKEENHLINYSN